VCQDIRDILPTLIILFFGLLIMVLVIPYAFRNRDPLFSGDHTAKNQYRKIGNKYSQKRNCAVTIPIFTFMCL
jgi:hypothetical protein